ncbi:thioredoxin domain-containing protein [Candidatus Poribacteria bacterium]|nr:thioredoxin domain-containing protein [Candidatus Poribacteria bacterium]
MMRLSPSIFLIISLSATLGLPSVRPESRAWAQQDVIASLNGEPITRGEIESRAATKLYRLKWEIYDTLKTEAEALANERLLESEAKRREISVEELLQTEVRKKAQAPADEEVDSYIRENHIAAGTDGDMRSRIVMYLTERASIQRKLDLLEELLKKSDFQFLLEPPQRPRANVSVDDDPVRGSPDASITIIHFASFSCEHCAESAQKIQKLFDEFPGAIRWVHRDFLNMFDERGLAAAEAAEAAYAHGKFWEFHDRIYSLSGDFKQEDLGGALKDIGVAQSEYGSSGKSANYILEIKHDIEDGVAAGVTGVPTIFINGRQVSGTFSYEKLKEMVEEELRAESQAAGKREATLP